MSQVIPTGDGVTPFFDVQVTLEDVTYTLELRWNVRSSAWYMNVLDAEGVTMLQAGIKLVADWMLASYSVGAQPPGAFVARDTSGQGIDPTLEDLGTRVQLLYFSTEDLTSGTFR
jgi:hypothetical protein